MRLIKRRLQLIFAVVIESSMLGHQDFKMFKLKWKKLKVHNLPLNIDLDELQKITKQ